MLGRYWWFAKDENRKYISFIDALCNSWKNAKILFRNKSCFYSRCVIDISMVFMLSIFHFYLFFLLLISKHFTNTCNIEHMLL